MAKIKKAQNGDKTVDLPDVKTGYKARVDEKVSPEGVRTANLKVRRTIGGFFSGKKKGAKGAIPVYNVPQGKPESPERETSGRAGLKKSKSGISLKKIVKSAPRMRGVTPVPNGPLIKKKGEFKGSTLKNGGKLKSKNKK